MGSLRDVYKRFKENYRTESGGINLYPRFDNDLKQLIDYVGVLMGDVSFKEKNVKVDCTWRPPIGEDD